MKILFRTLGTVILTWILYRVVILAGILTFVFALLTVLSVVSKVQALNNDTLAGISAAVAKIKFISSP